MRVRMLVEVSGTRDGKRWPARGEILNVPSGEADDLVACGYAERLTEEPERAVSRAPEKRGRPRKGD